MSVNYYEEKNFLNCCDVILINDVNEFLNKLIQEYIVQKDEFVVKYKRNSEILEEIDSKILLLENKICYDDNIFNPSMTNDENEYRINDLNRKKTNILNDNIDIQKKIEYITIKIDETSEILSKVKSKNDEEKLNNCIESEKYKIDILRSQEFERKRIARDLHDTVIQNLTNLIHKAELTLKVMDIDSVRAKLELMSISKNTREIIDEIRNIIYDLRPMAFDDIGIDVIIDRKLSEIRNKGIQVKYEVEGESGKIDQVVLLTLIRIVGEACNNIVKHGQATRLDVRLKYFDNYIEIFIKDNGIGFDMKENKDINYESKSGFGLSMMKERVYLLSGIINFTSKQNEGTEIYVKVPKYFKEDSENGNKYSISG